LIILLLVKKIGCKRSDTKTIQYFVETNGRNYIRTIEKIMMNKWEPEADFFVMIHPC